MKKHAFWLALGAVIPISSILAWMILDNACSTTGGEKEVSECWRGWVGAWSGWFGGLMALAGAYLAFVTIQKQIEQQHLHNRQQELRNQRRHLMEEQNALVAITRALTSAHDINKQVQQPFQENEVEKFQIMISNIPVASLRNILGTTNLDPTFRTAVAMSMEMLEHVNVAEHKASDFAFEYNVACQAIGKHLALFQDRLSFVRREIQTLENDIADCAYQRKRCFDPTFRVGL
ncbi:hypothetical protein [Roseibium album]|uniref:hypothetical protein n=1 Tax=Roseibium album TaxID=311410 RepID=UPI002493101E|nr:hypothetical protein [Roseibium album]